MGEKFYKLKSTGNTRFSAYFDKSIENFEKRLETTIAALRKRVESKDKEVRDKTKQICSNKFLILNLGLLDAAADSPAVPMGYPQETIPALGDFV